MKKTLDNSKKLEEREKIQRWLKKQREMARTIGLWGLEDS
jgi:hypothetical protein